MPPIIKQIKKPKNIIKTIKEVFFYYKNQKKSFIIGLIITCFECFFSVGAIIVNGFLYSWFIIPSSFIVVQQPPDYSLFGLFSFIWITCSYLLLQLLIGFFTWVNQIIFLKLSEKSNTDLRNYLFKKIYNMPINFFDTIPTGDIMSRAINDIDSLGQAMSQNLANFLYYALEIILLLTIMFLVNAMLAIFGIILIPLSILLNALVIKRIQPFFKKQQKYLGDLNGLIEENVSGMKVISLFNMKKETEKDFEEINKKHMHNSIVASASSNIMLPLNIFINNISFVLFTTIGIFGLFFGGNSGNGWISTNWGVFNFYIPDYVDPAISSVVTKTTLLIVFTLIIRTVNSTSNQFVSIIGSMFLALVSAERVLEILKKVEESDDENALEMKKIKGEIKAVNLNFQYVPDKKILKNVNFLIKPGKTTAIVGPTGGGKSTIISLITRFYNVTSGDLLLDDTPIKNIKLKSLRKNIAMIPQDTFLFNDTIFENIRYGNIDATNDEIIKAAKATQANNFIEKMSKKYETRLDDNAITLSQGQKQLIAITRAFLSKAKIIILDEATSSVDSDTELKIEEAIKRVSKNKTTIVIAHRLSTIKNADNILVVKDGKIFEQGNHKQLLKKNGFYAKLYNSQFTTGNIEDK